jgi:hypothetical protein
MPEEAHRDRWDWENPDGTWIVMELPLAERLGVSPFFSQE